MVLLETESKRRAVAPGLIPPSATRAFPPPRPGSAAQRRCARCATAQHRFAPRPRWERLEDVSPSQLERRSHRAEATACCGSMAARLSALQSSAFDGGASVDSALLAAAAPPSVAWVVICGDATGARTSRVLVVSSARAHAKGTASAGTMNRQPVAMFDEQRHCPMVTPLLSRIFLRSRSRQRKAYAAVFESMTRWCRWLVSDPD